MFEGVPKLTASSVYGYGKADSCATLLNVNSQTFPGLNHSKRQHNRSVPLKVGSPVDIDGRWARRNWGALCVSH